MKKGDRVTINSIEYDITCAEGAIKKYPYCDDTLGVHLRIVVQRVKDGHILDWNELKDTYIAEKLLDYFINTINGQRSFYWDYEDKKSIEVE